MSNPFKRKCQRKRTRIFRKTNITKARDILGPSECLMTSKRALKSVFLNKKISNASVMLILKISEDIFFKIAYGFTPLEIAISNGVCLNLILQKFSY